MRRRFATLLVLCLAFGVYVVPVQAAMSQCSGGRFCVWENANYSAGFDSWGASQNDWPLFGLENDDDSVWNRENTRTLVYRGSNYSEGVTYCVPPGIAEDDIHFDRDDNGDSNALALSSTSCSGYNPP